MSPFESGLVFLALSAGPGSASYFSGRLAEKWPADRLMAIGMLISAVGIVALTSVTSLWLYTALFSSPASGWGSGGRCRASPRKPCATDYVGAASGVTLTALVMLGAVGVAIGAAMLEVLAGSACGEHQRPGHQHRAARRRGARVRGRRRAALVRTQQPGGGYCFPLNATIF